MPQCLVIPRQLKFTADRILKSTLQNDTANNALNILKSDNSLPGGSKINHFLTDADAWFILTSVNEQGEGLVHYENESMSFGTDNEFDNFNMKVIAFERYAFGWDDFLGVFGNAGA